MYTSVFHPSQHRSNLLQIDFRRNYGSLRHASFELWREFLPIIQHILPPAFESLFKNSLWNRANWVLVTICGDRPVFVLLEFCDDVFRLFCSTVLPSTAPEFTKRSTLPNVSTDMSLSDVGGPLASFQRQLELSPSNHQRYRSSFAGERGE